MIVLTLLPQMRANKNNIQFEDLKLKVIDLTNDIKNIIIINADNNVSHGYVINVLDVLRSIEGLKIAISTKPVD